MERTFGTSLAILACSLPQSILPPHVSDQDLGGKHVVSECSISTKNKKISNQILMDTGASEYAFISDSCAQTHNLPLIPLSTFITLETFDGRPVVSRNIAYMTILDLSIN